MVDERKETPIFDGGGQTAAGKFEAPFQPVSSSTDPANRESVPNHHKQKVSDSIMNLLKAGLMGRL